MIKITWGGTVKASKKNSTWLWLIKIFYIFLKEDLKASEKHANCLKSLHGKFRQFVSIIQMFAKESEEPSPQEITQLVGEVFPILSILH